jgi:hypothetical protein
MENRKIAAIELSKDMKVKMLKYKVFRDQILSQQNISKEEKPLTFTEYFKQIIQNGSDEEKQEILKCIKQPLFIHNGEIISNPII